jgi:hypothetical protein
LAVAEDERYIAPAELTEIEALRVSASKLTLRLLEGLRKRLKEES